MSQITIRGIAPEVEKKIRRIAKDTGRSINSVIQEIIHQHTGFNSKRDNAPSEALRRLAGGWSAKEASDFNAAIQSFEQIDEEMWK
jgi:phosphopantetheinyl transferase (holo-ACP synthase)